MPSGLANPNKRNPAKRPTTVLINSVSQPRVSQSGYERVLIKGTSFAAFDKSQTWK